MKLSTLFLGILKLAFISLAGYAALGMNPYISFLVLVLLSITVPMPQGATFGVVLETWNKYIIARFWKDNAFLKFAYNESENVLLGRIVHIPQISGTKINVTKNRTVFPAVAVRRTDTDVTYTLDEYTTDPTHIPNIDKINLSYSKQDSVLGDQMGTINETIADDLLIKWGANAPIYKTTGGNNANTTAGVGAQTGTRKTFDHRDLKNLMTRMNATNVPKTGRYVMIDDNMYDAFYDSLSDTNAKDFSRYADAENGVVGKLHSFSIMTRSAVLTLTSADAVKPLGNVLAATDNLASLAWQKDSVAMAIGDTTVFYEPAQPVMYGDTTSALVMMGGRVRRADSLGVYIIEQGT